MAASSDYLVFADESGDHGMVQINADYPVFVLSCCVFERTQYVERVCPEIQRFKMRWWPHDAVVLHSSQIKRRAPPYRFLSVSEKRERFLVDLTNVLASSPFTLIAVAVDKLALRGTCAAPVNPYSLALKCCMEGVWKSGAKPKMRSSNQISDGSAMATIAGENFQASRSISWIKERVWPDYKSPISSARQSVVIY